MIQLVELKILYRTELLEPGESAFIDIFPFVTWFPSFLAKWKRRAATIREAMQEMYYRNLRIAKEKLADHNQSHFHSLFGQILARVKKHEKIDFTEQDLAFMGGAILEASMDTTLASFESFMLCVLAHEKVLNRLQRELDEVCGEKCPEPTDIENLPYLQACLNEASESLRDC